MLLFVDNYDSFTYNLIQYFQILSYPLKIIRNDELAVADCFALKPSAIVIGPGPGSPNDAGISSQLIFEAAGKVPLLGVCLGHQAIAKVFGGDIVRAKFPLHGKTDQITHSQSSLFQGLPNPLSVTRYHSLIVNNEILPSCLEAIAYSSDGEIMALQHKTYNLYGIQFHPESILSEGGIIILQNFLSRIYA